MTQQLFRLAWVNMLMWQRMSMRICFFDSSGLGNRMSCLEGREHPDGGGIKFGRGGVRGVVGRMAVPKC